MSRGYDSPWGARHLGSQYKLVITLLNSLRFPEHYFQVSGLVTCKLHPLRQCGVSMGTMESREFSLILIQTLTLFTVPMCLFWLGCFCVQLPTAPSSLTALMQGNPGSILWGARESAFKLLGKHLLPAPGLPPFPFTTQCEMRL